MDHFCSEFFFLRWNCLFHFIMGLWMPWWIGFLKPLCICLFFHFYISFNFVSFLSFTSLLDMNEWYSSVKIEAQREKKREKSFLLPLLDIVFAAILDDGWIFSMNTTEIQEATIPVHVFSEGAYSIIYYFMVDSFFFSSFSLNYTSTHIIQPYSTSIYISKICKYCL